MLPALKGMAGALFRPAELVGFDGSTATLSFDNDATRDNAERKRAEVEEAAAVHFGQPVKLKLTVGGPGGSPAPKSPSSTAQAPAPEVAAQADEAEIIDVHDLEDAPADTRTGVDRLTEAFPGAELLPEETP